MEGRGGEGKGREGERMGDGNGGDIITTTRGLWRECN